MWALSFAALSLASPLEDVVGRTQVVVRSAAYSPVVGRGTAEQGLLERLERLGYARVQADPTEPGTYAVSDNQIVVYGRPYRHLGASVPARRWAVREQGGVVVEVDDHARIEPEVILSALEEARAPVVRVRLAELPEHVWRPVLALEDHRFFDHGGVSGRAVARALLANARKGGVAEGGSTLTQQLVKNRDLKPRRALDRKASEAVRAIAVEARWEKAEILQAYLNTVYYGHVGGVGVYGIGQAANVWFGKSASRLTLAESALLAAILQGPNAHHPVRHPDSARARRDQALRRMAELGWASEAEVARALASDLGVEPRAPEVEIGRPASRWIHGVVQEDASHRDQRDLGFEVDTTLDPWLQARTLSHTRAWLHRLRKDHPALREAPLHAVVVVVDVARGELLAYVRGDPDRGEDNFDRAVQARRQPGSTIKPLLLLSAYQRCGERDPVRPSTLLSDAPVTLQGWTPDNAGAISLGPVPAREALVRSANRPFVHLALTCGLDALADTVETAGLDLPDPAPSSFLLGSVEASPMDLLRAYTLFPGEGRVVDPRLVARIGRPNGTRTGGEGISRTRVAPPGPAWLVSEDLVQVVERGTGQAARVHGASVGGKTGTSSDNRDAWFVGFSGDRAAVVWVGLDKGKLGLSGAYSAAPLWASVMADVVATAPAGVRRPPSAVRTCRVDPKTGLSPGLTPDPDAVAVPCLRGARPDPKLPWSPGAVDRIGPAR